ncbi:MAG TPA: molybdopterin cofactor-binding domain-containing protein [Herpetosiphonaceae bacterium]
MMRFRRRKAQPQALTPEQQARKQQVSRRRFLIATGATGVGLLVVCTGGQIALDRFRASLGSSIPELTSDPNAWLRIEPDNRIRLLINKIEMGQGIATAAAQIVAEELNVTVDQIELVPGTTNEIPPDDFGTVGSQSVMSLYPALRQAGATARQTLLELAAQRSGQPIDRLVAANGRVTSTADASFDLSYGELVRGQRIEREARGEVPLKAPSSYSVIGQSVPRLDIPDKVTGAAVYGYDAQPEGMCHGRVVRPPVIGATLQSVDLRAARQEPGVIAVVQEDDFIGVVAETATQAAVAFSKIQPQWKQPERLLQQADVEALLVPDRDAMVLREVGDAQRMLGSATSMISAEYRTSFATQAPIEPQVGVVDVQADRATVWTSTQAPFSVRGQIAEITGLKDEQITVVPLLIGGGFGRKSVSDAAYEAARLSKAAGRPVRVAWGRTEEFSHGFMRPPTTTRFRAALDAAGQIAAWQQDFTSGFVLFSFFPSFLRLVFGSDFGATRGAIGPYVLPHQRVTATMKDLPVKTGSWRGLGIGPNTFAVEQFMDELALAAGEDPLAFRLRYLPPDGAQGPATRMRRVLETAAQAANWGAPLPPDTGRGIACGMDAGTYVAEVAEVRVDRQSGAVQVQRVWAAIDCGLTINPNTVTAQTEGGIMMGLSAALKEEITLKDGKWSAASFAEYPFFTMADAPEIEVKLIENRETAPGGMGEPPLMPAAAAVGNAIAAAVGARVRTMPMTPERVLAALKEQQD